MSTENSASKFEFELAHIGINAQNEEEAASIAHLFCTMFGLEYKPNVGSIFAGTAVEVLKSPYLGKNGHIAISTPYMEEAIEYLKNSGYAMNSASTKYAPEGGIQAIYLEQEIGGFAVHLLRKK